jgi:hypothetical protein
VRDYCADYLATANVYRTINLLYFAVFALERVYISQYPATEECFWKKIAPVNVTTCGAFFKKDGITGFYPEPAESSSGPSYFSKISFNKIPPSASRTTNGIFTSGCFIEILFHSYCMPCNLILFDYHFRFRALPSEMFKTIFRQPGCAIGMLSFLVLFAAREQLRRTRGLISKGM